MRRILYLFLIILGVFVFSGCGEKIKEPTDKELLEEFLSQYTYDTSKEKFAFPGSIEYKEKLIKLEWDLSEEVLDSEGNIIYTDEVLTAEVKVIASLGEEKQEKVVGSISSKPMKELIDKANEELLEEFLNSYEFKQEDNLVIELPKETTYKEKLIKLEWILSEEILDANGNIIHKENQYEATVTLKALLGDSQKEKVVGKIVSLSSDEMKQDEKLAEELIERFAQSYKLEIVGDERIVLRKELPFEGKWVAIKWIVDKKLIKEDGTFKHGTTTQETEIKAEITYKDYSKTYSFGNITIRSSVELVNEVIANLTLPTEVNEDIELPTFINGVSISWFSEESYVLTDEGKCYYVSSDTNVILTALFSCGSTDMDKEYTVVVKPYKDERRLELALETIELPAVISGNVELKEEYAYDTKATWTSSREDVISAKGVVKLQSDVISVVLKVKLYIGDKFMEKSFTVKTVVLNKLDKHFLVDKVDNFNKDGMFNVEVKDELVQLKDNEVYGYYDSGIYETLNFDEIVGSWAALSSETATCELLVKVMVNGEWSKYFTYGIWGLGRNNLYYNQTDKNAKMSVDEILITNGTATAFQYKVIFRRDSAECESPKLRLVAMALNIPGYKYEVDVTGLPTFVDYDVPKLNQNIVPVIGNSICSATTSTMLLKYKGFDFSDKDEFEHRYIANLVADRGHNSPTYGNWVYNTVTMGAFGLSSYVKRLYSWEELKWHLANVGPVGASIKGNAVLYTTGGHLIVARGYREVDGKTYVICNDPNINERFGNDANGNPYFVYYEFPLDVFMNFWRGVIYVVE